MKKFILITGSGSGIGKETALSYSNKKNIVFVADLDYDSALETVKTIQSKGNQAIALKVNVANTSSVDDMFKKIQKHTKRIDILVNNVGIELTGELSTFSLNKYNQLFDVNVKSVFLCSQKVLPFMKKNGGSIVNLASVASFKTWPEDGVYSATKAAVAGLTKGFALDYVKFNIRVNAVAPAIVDTPMTDRAIIDKNNMKEEKKKKGLVHPMKRIAKPKEVANAIKFLASKKSSFTTGTILLVDGGLLA